MNISYTSLALSIIWNISYFTMHLELALSKSYLHYLSLPAFWYFLVSFVFQFRLFIWCWKIQHESASRMDYTFLRRKLFIFYCQFYFTCIFFNTMNRYILEVEPLLFILNGSLWVPQIIMNYQNRSRKGPTMFYVISLTASQSFLPIYSRLCPQNIFDKEQTIVFGMVFIAFLIAQVSIIFLQKTLGPRFFIPKRFRRNPNVYDYFVKIKNHSELRKRAATTQSDRQSTETNQNADIESLSSTNSSQRNDLLSIEDELKENLNYIIYCECVICMNSLVYEVQQDQGEGLNSSRVGQEGFRQAKYYLKTPCNHRYHVQCLQRWMEIRLECPSCRCVIPPIQNED